ncbi:VOC family protein [Pseudonocardia lacus]|uniref:VOC family protein n=1 Tax=Pseudonocardia lacus TaxID=2835865 RepID=UPI001BDCC251|nr:VOC family protein [Pseudonocardia lacus]
MRLENIVWDARDPHLLGPFWTAALAAEPMTDEPDLVEARLNLSDDVFLDLCFQQVDEPSTSPARLHLDLAGGERQREVVRRLLDLGAEHADVGQGQVPWTVLADPEGGAFCVMEDREAYRATTGPIAALPLDSADPERDAAFWAEITDWVPATGTPGVTTLRHPSGVGPLLELCPEPEPSRGKNRLHLDVRPDAARDHDIVERVLRRGATALSEPGEHPWRIFTDPSGNEFCVLAPLP